MTPSFVDICAELNARAREVVERYCIADGAYTDAAGRYFCLSPLRTDRRVGSFCVNVTGSMVGRWVDFSTGEKGDMLDLVEHVEGQGKAHAVHIAKQLLGLVDLDEGRARAFAVRKARRDAELRAERERHAEQVDERRRWAQRLWLSAEPDITGTLVARYLQGRGIDLGQLPRQVNALRFHQSCTVKDHDPDTGEVIEGQRPAMLAGIIGRDGTHIGTHRTYLQAHPDGRVTKARQASPKKVLGQVMGASIRVWAGIGPRGGKPCQLGRVQPGAHVFIAEGIEDALSAAVLKPDARVLAAVSLQNMAAVELPDAVTRVTIIADNDNNNEQAAELLEKACQRHAAAGREVRIWRNTLGGKDLNDALTRAVRQGEADAA